MMNFFRTNPSWLNLDGNPNFEDTTRNQSDEEASIESNIVGPESNFEEQGGQMMIYNNHVGVSNGCSNNVNKSLNVGFTAGVDLKNGPNIEVTDI